MKVILGMSLCNRSLSNTHVLLSSTPFRDQSNIDIHEQIGYIVEVFTAKPYILS